MYKRQLHSSFSLKGYEEEFLATFFLYLICGTAVFLLFRIYNKMWQYADIVEYLYIGTACVVEMCIRDSPQSAAGGPLLVEQAYSLYGFALWVSCGFWPGGRKAEKIEILFGNN